ncbi:MAG TPA: hypothetical protein VGF81_13100 [Solirubrobacteraceae bacterium]
MRAAARAALGLVALAQAEIGIWGIAAPHSFFTTYPGLGHHWVAPLGSYNEHLVRDFAAAELGFAVLLACAAIWFERPLVLVAGAAFLAATVPHFAYHLTTTDHLSTTDNTASLGGFLLEIMVVIWVMVVAVRRPSRSRQVAAETG